MEMVLFFTFTFFFFFDINSGLTESRSEVGYFWEYFVSTSSLPRGYRKGQLREFNRGRS